MELKLNVYDGKKIEKTYTAEDFMLMTGTCEDILQVVDIDKFGGTIDEKSLGMEILKVVIKSFGKFKPMMKEIFDGLTDDEYSRTAIKEVAGVVVQIVMYTITELFSGITPSKN
ncbi:MAG: hypothetical protein MJY71_08235 [Bacteroidaceae bacterium]|nr:hypothetical protein [Bacteroidaceae bacterium]